MARIISVSNHKGGVGKTTITANLGFALARQFKVLLVDVDPQANLSTGLGFKDQRYCLDQYLKEKIHYRNPEIVPYALNAYVHIIPCTLDLIKIENLLHETVRAEWMLKEILAPLRNSYDLILLDCPPSFTILTLNALKSSNLILVPAKPETFSVHGIKLLNDFANEHNVPFKIVFNQINSRTLFHKRIMEEVKEMYPEQLLTSNIKNAIALAEAFSCAQDIFNYRTESSAAQDFANLADELIPFI